jgi:hypothetical protein
MNVITKTEQFDDAVWAKTSVTVTANSQAAPVFAGGSAGLADTLDDASAVVTGVVEWGYTGVANDSSPWVCSVFIRKDAITSRFPVLGFQIVDGTSVVAGISINTSTGAVANVGDIAAPATSGVVDFDSLWWRAWLQKPNNSSGNADIKMFLNPAYSSALGGTADSTVTGSIVAWGANLTNDATVQTYIPDPFYAFAVAGTDLMVVAAPRVIRYEQTFRL